MHSRSESADTYPGAVVEGIGVSSRLFLARAPLLFSPSDRMPLTLLLSLLLLLCFQGVVLGADSGPFHGVLADSQLMPDTPLRRLAFGSCECRALLNLQSTTSYLLIGNHDDDPQPFWPILTKLEPQAFVWLGDIVYNDVQTGFLPSSRQAQPIPVMRKKYQSQKQNEAYRSFADTGVIITGVWDDHDYGEFVFLCAFVSIIRFQIIRLFLQASTMVAPSMWTRFRQKDY